MAIKFTHSITGPSSFLKKRFGVACSKWATRLVENKMEEIWHNVPLDFDLPAIDPAEYED
ncbi:MAG TPA: hypothetical protein VGO47_14080 [Chlamydiales bacterium]|nr:hypothetical protein [Chlamydiales bacterium]